MAKGNWERPMDGRRLRAFGLIEVLIIMVIVVSAFVLLRTLYYKKTPDGETMRYDKIYNDAKKKLEKVNAERPNY